MKNFALKLILKLQTGDDRQKTDSDDDDDSW